MAPPSSWLLSRYCRATRVRSCLCSSRRTALLWPAMPEIAPFCVGMWKPASQCRRTSLQMFGLEMGTDSGWPCLGLCGAPGTKTATGPARPSSPSRRGWPSSWQLGMRTASSSCKGFRSLSPMLWPRSTSAIALGLLVLLGLVQIVSSLPVRGRVHSCSGAWTPAGASRRRWRARRRLQLLEQRR